MFFHCIFRKITLCALEAFVFAVVSMVSGKSMLLDWNSQYYNQFLQGFCDQDSLTTSNSFQFRPILIHTFFVPLEKSTIFTNCTVLIIVQ